MAREKAIEYHRLRKNSKIPLIKPETTEYLFFLAGQRPLPEIAVSTFSHNRSGNADMFSSLSFTLNPLCILRGFVLSHPLSVLRLFSPHFYICRVPPTSSYGHHLSLVFLLHPSILPRLCCAISFQATLFCYFIPTALSTMVSEVIFGLIHVPHDVLYCCFDFFS